MRKTLASTAVSTAALSAAPSSPGGGGTWQAAKTIDTTSNTASALNEFKRFIEFSLL